MQQILIIGVLAMEEGLVRKRRCTFKDSLWVVSSFLGEWHRCFYLGLAILVQSPPKSVRLAAHQPAATT